MSWIDDFAKHLWHKSVGEIMLEIAERLTKLAVQEYDRFP